MTLISDTAAGSKLTVIRIDGTFDFSVHREMREAYRHIDEAGHEFRVDMTHTQYLDSAALGMLLLLREHAEERQCKVVLAVGKSPVRRILQLAKFDMLFAIAD